MADFSSKQRNVLHSALRTYGLKNQTMMVAEECAELTKASSKLIRHIEDRDWQIKEDDLEIINLKANLTEEIADVIIMCEQMKLAHGISSLDVQEMVNFKINRLENKLNEYKEKLNAGK